MKGIDKNMKYYVEAFDDTFGNATAMVMEYSNLKDAKNDAFWLGSRMIRMNEENLRDWLKDSFDPTAYDNLAFSIYAIKGNKLDLSLDELKEALRKGYDGSNFYNFIKKYCVEDEVFYSVGLPKSKRESEIV